MDERTVRLSARPEARFALFAGIAGAIAATAISVKGIFASASSTAAIGFVFVPLIAAAAAVPAGVWGLALGCVWRSARGAQRYFPAVLAMAWVVVLAAPAAVGWEVWRGLELERAVAEVKSMDGARLEQAFERSPWNRDRFFLGAIAQNERASDALLERIARLEDPELYEKMGSVWDVMGANRKGLAVMRLVAANPNTGAAALEHLAAKPEAEYVLSDVLRNPKTPMKVLERHFDSPNHLLEWGLALNPKTPPAVLERLSKSANLYTRMNLTYNAATPRPILERLAQDADPTLARNARHALERRATGG